MAITGRTGLENQVYMNDAPITVILKLKGAPGAKRSKSFRVKNIKDQRLYVLKCVATTNQLLRRKLDFGIIISLALQRSNIIYSQKKKKNKSRKVKDEREINFFAYVKHAR